VVESALAEADGEMRNEEGAADERNGRPTRTAAVRGHLNAGGATVSSIVELIGPLAGHP
jgi:hypothetical protein